MRSFLKKSQIDLIKKYGNTIVSKKYSIKEIESEFLNFGIKVRVKEFSIPDKTHYIIENLEFLAEVQK